MFKNYLKVAWRNLRKERLYAGINLLGLSIGVAVAILLLLYVRDEWSFDRFHTEIDRIHRVWVKEHVENELYFNTVTPFIVGRELEANFPEIEHMARYMTVNDLIQKGDFSDKETVHLVSEDFFEVFDFPWQQGDPEAFSQDLRQVALTPAMAEKYFGRTDIVGQSLSVRIGGEFQEFLVSGIIAPAPVNSSIQFDFLIPFENTKSFVSENARNNWMSVTPETYVLFREGIDRTAFESKLATFIDDKVSQHYEPGEYIVGFQPMADIHLNNDYPAGIVPVSDGRYPYILLGIAILILVLAGINFVTLALGRSVSRAREVGVRKVSGAQRWQLMLQFWTEAVLIAVFSVAAGVLLALLLLPVFNTLSAKALTIDYSPISILSWIGMAVVIGILAGLYPALVISGYKPLRALRGTTTKLGRDKHLVLRGLVGFQFVLSVVLIICTLVMQSQMRYIQNKNLGFNKEQVLVLPYSEAPSVDKGLSVVYAEGKRAGDLLREKIAGHPAVEGVAVSSHAFGTPGWTRVGYQDATTQQIKFFHVLNTDEHFLNVMDVDAVAGRTFSPEITTDAESAVLVNRAMADMIGVTDPIGSPLPKPFESFTVIGMTDDFNYGTLHSPVAPLAITMNYIGLLQQAPDMMFTDRPTAKISVKLRASEVNAGIQAVQEAWEQIVPDQPFDFHFVDEAVNQQYASEQRLSRIITLGSLLAIVIACLGLFGIATLTVGQRQKEIGVRKVLGASVLNIFMMLNRQLTILVLLATVLAAPLAYWLMQQWLDDFAYRVGINALWFVVAALVAVGVAWLAVSYQSIKAARLNPVESLRME